MIDRFQTFTVLVTKINRSIKKLKADEMAKYDLKSPHVSCIYYLYENGVKNYFVTGAVVDKSIEPPMGMYEEVLGLNFQIGEGKTVEDILGSTWNEKIPKDEVMRRLVKELGINGENVLVVGDGRSEISAGVKMGAFTVSILPENATRQRELHKELGTNMIIPNYTAADIKDIIK